MTPTQDSTPPFAPGAAPSENLWHREWMEQTENAYEWWYFDSVSEGDGGEWSLVVIFLLGSPFSPYSRECELGLRPDPIHHNGVFVALHHRGRLLHYLYARYPPGAISGYTADSSSTLGLQFGPNTWREPSPGSFVIALNEENANRRRITARLTFSASGSGQASLQGPLNVQSDPRHRWLPVVVGGSALCEIELHSPGETHEPERIVFRGGAYHDHNWGTLPFEATIRQWLWARADFGPGRAAVVYQTIPARRDQPTRTLLLTSKPGEPLQTHTNAEVRTIRSARNGYGIVYPREIIARYDGDALTWRFGRSLESTPFYMRCLSESSWEGAAPTQFATMLHGQGIGEMLRPRGMGAWLVSHAMRLRIYEPGL